MNNKRIFMGKFWQFSVIALGTELWAYCCVYHPPKIKKTYQRESVIAKNYHYYFIYYSQKSNNNLALYKCHMLLVKQRQRMEEGRK